MDILLFIVGVLTALVAILLSWQIFTAIKIERKVDRVVGRAVERLREEIMEEMEKNRVEVLGRLLFSVANSAIHTYPAYAFEQYVLAAGQLYLYDRDCKQIKICFEQLRNIISDLKEKKEQLVFYGNTKQNILNVLYTIIRDDKEDIIKFVLNDELCIKGTTYRVVNNKETNTPI